jgi:hypothetical protein
VKVKPVVTLDDGARLLLLQARISASLNNNNRMRRTFDPYCSRVLAAPTRQLLLPLRRQVAA